MDKPYKFTAREVALAITRDLYAPNAVTILPNVSWGMGLSWEADLVVVSQALYAMEIEVKVTVADFRNDFKKPKHERLRKPNCVISSMAYAMPEDIWEKAGVVLPEDYGVILVTREKSRWIDTAEYLNRAAWHKRPKKFNKNTVTMDRVRDMHRLGYLRMWDRERDLVEPRRQ